MSIDSPETKIDPPKQVSLTEEACKLVYLNFGQDASRLYQVGLKEKAEKEMLRSLEDSLSELVGPEHAENQMKPLWEKHSQNKY